MTDTTVAEGGEAPSSEVVETPVSEAPATDFEAKATEMSNRFAGSQRKLTETLAEKAKLAEEIEALRKYKAEQERADMTEVDRYKAEAEEARNEAAQARSEAQREKLARKYPLAVELFGDDALPSEERLATLNEKLAAGDEETDDATIDPNRPRKAAPPPPPDPLDAADAWLRSTLS